MTERHLLSCDWGTSRLRLRLATLPDGAILAEHASDAGVGRIAAALPTGERDARFRACLTAALDDLATRTRVPLNGVPVLVSGMAGASIGWREVPYAPVPFALSGTGATTARLPAVTHGAGSNPVTIIGGVACADDVMRGEETEAAGAARLLGLDTGVLVMPGTHSKHVQIVDGAIRHFTTHMTGELFALLQRHSVLQHSVADADSAVEVDMTAFLDGVAAAARLPLAAALFKTRTRQLLQRAGPAAGRAFLSGVLIGAEAAALAAESSLADQRILICAGSRLAPSYQAAFARLLPHATLELMPPALGDTLMLHGHLRFAQAAALLPPAPGTLPRAPTKE